MPKPLLSLLRLIVAIIQMAGLMAYFVEYQQWNALMAVIVAIALTLFLPLAATILGFIGAMKVWGWAWWVAMLVFLPGLALSLTAIAGVSLASLVAAFALKRVRQQSGRRQPPHQAANDDTTTERASGEVIEGEVISSHFDNEPKPKP